MDDDALQIYHDPKAATWELRAVIDSLERDIVKLREKIIWTENSEPTVPLPPLQDISGNG